MPRSPHNTYQEPILPITLEDHARLARAAQILDCPQPPRTTAGYERKAQLLLVASLLNPCKKEAMVDLFYWLSVNVEQLKHELEQPHRQMGETSKLLKLQNRDLLGLIKVVKRRLHQQRQARPLNPIRIANQLN